MAAPETFLGVVLADRYEIRSVLGQGQGGMVFKALHRQLDRFVAVKLLNPQNTDDKTAYMRFEREAHSIGRLNHPNIVTVIDVGRFQNERPFLVMDYIEGQDLQDLVGKEGRLPIGRSLRLCAQVCSALYHAHKRGVVHRDLKPRNIMIIDAEDINDFVKLVDFGIAKNNGSEEFNEALTLDGYVVGTPLYMAPEQCCNGKVDARTDIYALCAVLFKMITGVTPIGGSNLGEIMHNQITAMPLSFEEACPYVQVPLEIQQVIYKGLSKKAESRQESMAQLRAELNEAFARVATTLGQDALGTPSNDQSNDLQEQKNSFEALRNAAVAGDPIAQYELVIRLEHGQGCIANPVEAKRWLVYAAQNGLREAQWRIGDHLLRGDEGFENRPEEAVSWLTKSAEQGYDAAQFTLGWCFEHGLGTNANLQTACHWYQKAAKQGNAYAIEQLRLCLEKVGEPTASISTADKMAETEMEVDDPETLYKLGCKLRDSGHRSDDKAKALHLFKRAAALGHDRAHLDYICVALNHASEVEEKRLAFKNLESAHAENNSAASLILAACLRSGISCEKNPQRAMSLLEDLAINRNFPAAKTVLAAALLAGDGTQRNIPRGITLLKQAAEEGEPTAQWKFAICNRNGVGVTKDQRNAELYFQKAAEAGFPQGVEDMWKPLALSFSEAVQIFKSLTASGNKNAFYWLGICYERGLGVPQDTNLALSNYEQAYSKGLQSGQAALERIKANSTSQ